MYTAHPFRDQPNMHLDYCSVHTLPFIFKLTCTRLNRDVVHIRCDRTGTRSKLVAAAEAITLPTVHTQIRGTTFPAQKHHHYPEQSVVSTLLTAGGFA